MSPGTYYVRMKINEQWMLASDYCGGNQNADDCKLEVSEIETPYCVFLS